MVSYLLPGLAHPPAARRHFPNWFAAGQGTGGGLLPGCLSPQAGRWMSSDGPDGHTHAQTHAEATGTCHGVRCPLLLRPKGSPRGIGAGPAGSIEGLGGMRGGAGVFEGCQWVWMWGGSWTHGHGHWACQGKDMKVEGRGRSWLLPPHGSQELWMWYPAPKKAVSWESVCGHHVPVP